MPATILVGTQWGDEGKGKATDLLADQMDLVVRYQGGNNAGHTVRADEQTLKLHLIPSGILYPHITPVIADGVVIDPKILLEEMDELEGRGIDTSRLLISANAHLIMPYHLELDRVTERFLGKHRLGTTKRGIGPAYADKAARIGLRAQDLTDQKIFREKLEAALKEKNAILTRVYNRLPLDAEKIATEYLGYGERLASHIADTSSVLYTALRDGKRLLLEGAQGTLLDLDHGTYPFVTSSNPVAGGALVGTGLGPGEVERVIGVTKAYVTRVGSGPFPTEEEGEPGTQMQTRGEEVGTTTGRLRRCGWFDAVLLRYAARVNGLTELFLTKLDVLSDLPLVRVCVAYRYEGRDYEDFPPHQSIVHKAEPVYEDVEGWTGDLAGARILDDLPPAARTYVERIADLGGVPVRTVSVGPSREQTVEAA
ncbi:MAG TPA: adenylosuccinate synthase [Actinomycetota bacterium]|jgi:adenylosuccinate synthase|nr:adenylosuccinate synthase [Actinomycetota bacterium]